MKTTFLLALVATLAFAACQKPTIGNIPNPKSANWQSLRSQDFGESNYKSSDDPFKKVCAVVAADVGGGLVGGWIGAKLTGANPWGIGIGAVIVGGLASYGASGSAATPTWPLPVKSELTYSIEYFSNPNNSNFFNPMMIDHNSLLALSASSVQSASGVRPNFQEMLSIYSNSAVASQFASQTNYFPTFQSFSRFISNDGLVDFNAMKTDTMFLDFNFSIIEVYLENLELCNSAEGFINYSLAFENSIANDPTLTQNEKNATLAFCAIGRASMIYWINHI